MFDFDLETPTEKQYERNRRRLAREARRRGTEYRPMTPGQAAVAERLSAGLAMENGEYEGEDE